MHPSSFPKVRVGSNFRRRWEGKRLYMHPSCVSGTPALILSLFTFCSLIPSSERESVPILDSNPLPISMEAMQSMNVPTVELVNTHTGDKITKASHRSSHSTGTSTDSSSNSKARKMKTPFTLSLTRRSSTLSRRPIQRVGRQLINSSTT